MFETRKDLQELASHQILRRGEFAVRFFMREVDDPELFVKEELELAALLLDPDRSEDIGLEGFRALPATEIMTATASLYDVSPTAACALLAQVNKTLKAIPAPQPAEDLHHTLEVMGLLQVRLLQNL